MLGPESISLPSALSCWAFLRLHDSSVLILLRNLYHLHTSVAPTCILQTVYRVCPPLASLHILYLTFANNHYFTGEPCPFHISIYWWCPYSDHVWATIIFEAISQWWHHWVSSPTRLGCLASELHGSLSVPPQHWDYKHNACILSF